MLCEYSKKEEAIMPGRDKTGPSGFGPLTGRRMGLCSGNYAPFNTRRGLGFRRGYGRGFGAGFGFGYGAEYLESNSNVSEKTILENDIRVLKEQLSSLEKQLKNIGEKKDE
jgi:hypothetical protein